MNRCPRAFGVLAVLVPLLAAGRAPAESLPLPGALDPRVRVAVYEPTQVVRLAAFVGYHIHLEFEPGEQFVGLGAGDMEGLSFSAQGSHLFLKPKAARVATNLTVITDRRHYLFEYSAEARRPDPRTDPVIYSLTFEYPPPVARVSAAAEPPRPKNTDYGYCGARSLKPLSVYDDGLHLYVRFPARADWPAVFLKNADGSESLVNFTVERDQLIVHRVAGRFILRRGRAVGCLINRAFKDLDRSDTARAAASGSRPLSGARR